MKKFFTVFMLVCLIGLLTGCAGDVKKQYVFTANTYAGTVDVMRDLHRAGVLSPEETAKVDIAITTGHAYLVEMKAAIDANTPISASMLDKTKAILEELINIQIAKNKY
jgi:hypothetical protein